ncbi:MAG: hypothetical protein Q8S75_01440, partial [Nitrospirota bacterium]|nr:hypothetical protein [Nitrospirota bacterium]
MMDHEWNAFSEKVAQGLHEYVEHPDRVSAAMRETIRHAPVRYRGSSISIQALAEQVRSQVLGHATIPEDQEYRYAVALVAVGKELSASARKMLEIYTGYDASKLEALGHESADAIS